MAPARPGCAAAGLGCPCCWESRGWRLAWAASPRTCTRQSPGAPSCSSSPCAVCRQYTVITKHTTKQYSTKQAAKVQHAKLCHGTEQYAAPQSVAKHCKAQQYKALQNIAKHCTALHCTALRWRAKHCKAQHCNAPCSTHNITKQNKQSTAKQNKLERQSKALQSIANSCKAPQSTALQSIAKQSTSEHGKAAK